MVRFLNYLVVFFLIGIYFSCIPIVHNKKKITIQEGIKITEIETNGYYFARDYFKKNEDKSIVARILFENGTFREIGRISSKDTSEYFNKHCFLTPLNTYESSKKNVRVHVGQL